MEILNIIMTKEALRQTAGNEKRALEFDLRKNHAFIMAELSQQNSVHAHLSPAEKFLLRC